MNLKATIALESQLWNVPDTDIHTCEINVSAKFVKTINITFIYEFICRNSINDFQEVPHAPGFYAWNENLICAGKILKTLEMKVLSLDS